METPFSQRRAHFGLQDRRSDFRAACEGTATLDVISPNPKRAVQVRIVDIGTASLKLSVPFFVSPGSFVRIYMTESHADAEVRYCTREGSAYYIGVKVEEVIQKHRAVVGD
jgi:hypothetical protein